MAKSDEELVSQAQAGDEDAFDELVARHQDRVFALSYRILANAEDAADIQQETFVRAWTRLKTFKCQAAFSTWVHKITVNLCLSRKRRQTIVEPLDEERLSPAESGAVACMQRTETKAVVQAAISELPPHYRVLIVLREIEGRSCEEIGSIVGRSADSVRTGLYRARRLLKDKIRPYLEEVDS
ncbi:MAG TPA: sigma-70 family RNA polymerase sigma factor [Armatimonadota bacterium]|nr:sigma-70 family RNA polymerase sigma factor [Armatimonadota bacterium]